MSLVKRANQIKKVKYAEYDFEKMIPRAPKSYLGSFLGELAGTPFQYLLADKALGKKEYKYDRKKPINSLLKKVKDVISTKRDLQILKDFGKKHGINPRIIAEKSEQRMGNAYYNPSSDEVVSNYKSLPILLHELGHAADYKSMGTLKSGLRLLGSMAGGLSPLMYGAPDRLAKYTPLIDFATHLPTLYQEGKASYLAMDHLRDAAKKYGPRFKGYDESWDQLPAAFGTYAIGAAAPSLGMYGAQQFMDLDKE